MISHMITSSSHPKSLQIIIKENHIIVNRKFRRIFSELIIKFSTRFIVPMNILLPLRNIQRSIWYINKRFTPTNLRITQSSFKKIERIKILRINLRKGWPPHENSIVDIIHSINSRQFPKFYDLIFISLHTTKNRPRTTSKQFRLLF